MIEISYFKKKLFEKHIYIEQVVAL